MNRMAKGVIRKLTGGLDPNFNQNIDNEVNPDGQPQNNAEFVANIERFIKGTAVERFFKNNPNFIKELAEKATALRDDPDTPICHQELMPKTTQVTMHQQVIYCDDSGSMQNGKRWDSQAELVNRIARITTRILPAKEGVALRFINQGSNDDPTLNFEQIREALQRAKWGGSTPIGTNLRSKILQPLVYDKLSSKLERPLLISIITDGNPYPEPRSTLVDAIVECGDKLEGADYPRESVKFVIGQVGSADDATHFLQDIANESKIRDVVFVVEGRQTSYPLSIPLSTNTSTNIRQRH
ncbi:hypothetical protein P280DRAFT_413668 [Massarina eburnea CBS 473.64]|uniref:VWFA domain-containing protein n=1 Tax=Massarina eburnea CBS 473.64 TaxID=1395130 RepID=A0A6A6RHA2_9PLEO|nr:hypothetical protein P280DRAFT_413668 [Massarina eburnea CBS 473.64]